MYISFGLLATYIFLATVGGAVVGMIALSLCRAAKSAENNAKFNEAKAEFFCVDCYHIKRAKELAEILDSRESYIRDLLQRIDQQRRSIAAMGGVIQKRTVRVA
jgi:hypothetical protein